MSFPDVPISLNNTAVAPANSQITSWIDTTQVFADALPASAASSSAPGKARNVLAGRRIMGSITPTAQSITVTFQSLIDPSGITSAAFAVDPNAPDAGTKVVAAGSTYVFDWMPRFNDVRILLTAGATTPTALTSTLTLVCDRSPGV